MKEYKVPVYVDRIKEIVSNQFIRNTAILVTGTTIAQLIPILVSPVLTRLFSPAEYGQFSLFIAAVGIISVLICGKYEMAIILPPKNDDAVNIIGLSLLIASAFSLFLMTAILLFEKQIIQLFKLNEIENWLLLIPVSCFLYGTYICFNEWCVRRSYFKILSKNKITNTVGISMSCLVFGALGFTQGGLIYGQLTGQIITVGLCLFTIFKLDLDMFKIISIRKMRELAREYINFPKYLIPSQFTNAFSGQLPIFFITAYFGSNEAGFFALAERMIAIPLSMIGQALADVFRQKAAVEYMQNGNCLQLYKKTTMLTGVLSLIFFSAIYLLSPWVFSTVFGEGWYTAGIYAQILCVMSYFNFVGMPVGGLFFIAKKEKLLLAWQVMYLIFTITPLLLGTTVLANAKLTILLYSLGRSIVYATFIVLTYRIAKGKAIVEIK